MYSRPSHSIYNIKISQSLIDFPTTKTKKKTYTETIYNPVSKAPTTTTTHRMAAKIKARQEKSFTFAKCLQTNPIQRQVFSSFLRIFTNNLKARFFFSTQFTPFFLFSLTNDVVLLHPRNYPYTITQSPKQFPE